MILSNIKQFFSRNKKTFYYIGFFIIIFSLLSDINSVNAFTATVSTGEGADTTKEFIDKVATVTAFFLKSVSVFLGLMTYLATVFLSPEWINGSLFGLNTHFKAVWILVSNVVYFVFAFILIWIAFMNIIGKSGDQYQLKQALPKFIVGVLIVPFSWFLIQFVLSISAILTVSALSLPFDTFKEFDGKFNNVTVPKHCTIDLKEITKDGFLKCDEENGVMLTETINEGDAIEGIFGIMSMYTYGVLSFDQVANITKQDILANVETLADLAVKIVFDFIFVIVYSVLMITLGIVLMIRGIYIWIYTMLSPIFGLMYFFDKKDGDFFGKFNAKEFISLAMVPVYTMLALSFGLLFIYIVGNGLTNTTGSETFKIDDPKGTSQEDANILIGGKFGLTIKGAAAKSENVTNMLTEIGSSGLGVIGSLIIKIFGIVVLWGTVMAAMRASEITKTITQPLHDFGMQVGKIAASGPANLPIFGGQSMKSMQQIGATASSHFDTSARNRGTDFLKQHKLFGQSSNMDLTTKSINARESLKHHGSVVKEVAKGYKEAYDTGKDISELSKSKDFISLTKMMAENMKIKGADKIKLGMNENDLAEIIGDIDYRSKNSINASTGGYDIISGWDEHGNATKANDLNKLKKSGGDYSDTEGGKSTEQPKIKHLDTKTIININGNDKIVTEYKDGQVTQLGSTTADDLAQYIDTKKLNKTSIDSLFRDLELSNSAIKELDEFFWEKDGKIIFARNKKDGKNGYNKSTLDGYIGQTP